MRQRPEALEDTDVREALAVDWGVHATTMRYDRQGGGSYHWDVGSADGSRWFVSATDLAHAPWLGADLPSSWQTLTVTMAAAATLRSHGLAFVVAPTPCRGGGTARLIRRRYGLVVHPFVDGACGTFGAPLPVDAADVIDLLSALHATPPASVDLHELVDLGVRDVLDDADPRFAPIVDRYEDLLERFASRPLVVTHGEPHAGNVMRSDELAYLIDWDTAALALPERDLWLLLDHGNSDVLRLYEDATGHVVDREALVLYRLRWTLEELIGAVRVLDDRATQRALVNARAAAKL